jgi:hypothetical protein
MSGLSGASIACFSLIFPLIMKVCRSYMLSERCVSVTVASHVLNVVLVFCVFNHAAIFKRPVASIFCYSDSRLVLKHVHCDFSSCVVKFVHNSIRSKIIRRVSEVAEVGTILIILHFFKVIGILCSLMGLLFGVTNYNRLSKLALLDRGILVEISSVTRGWRPPGGETVRRRQSMSRRRRIMCTNCTEYSSKITTVYGNCHPRGEILVTPLLSKHYMTLQITFWLRLLVLFAVYVGLVLYNLDPANNDRGIDLVSSAYV